MAAMLEGMVDKVVQVLTNDGRNIIGLLKGFDQTTNVILDECRERVFSSDAGVEEVQLGLYILRGDNMCAGLSPHAPMCTCSALCTPVADHRGARPRARSAVVGEVDQEEDGDIDWAAVVAEPLKPVVH